jgi:hypothetical protein
VKLELLFFDGCPGHERLLPRLRELADRAGAELVLCPVEAPEAAQTERFLGSPTVRVDGRYVETRTDCGIKCRIYRSSELGQSPVPPEQWILAALAGDSPPRRA